jgi:hypothetical protein
MVMLDNASYIQSELPGVPMSHALRERTEKMCDSLIGTKHDVITEYFELAELTESDAPTSATRRYVERIVRWLEEEVIRMDALVTDLNDAREKDPGHRLAFVLVAESAVNIIDAFNRTKVAADTVLADLEHTCHSSDSAQSAA